MRIRLLILFVFLVPAAYSSAQVKTTDFPVYRKAKALAQLCAHYQNNSTVDSLEKAARKGLALSNSIQHDSLSSVFEFYLGNAFFAISKYDQALASFRQSEVYAAKVNSNDLFMMSHTGIANIYEVKGVTDSVFTYVNDLETRLKKVKDDHVKQFVTNRLGGFYADHDQYEKSIIYYMENIHLDKKLEDNNDVGVSLVNVGNIYLQMSKSEKALPYFKEAITYLADYKLGLVVCNNNIGASFTNLNKPDSAIAYHLKAIKIARAIKDSSDIYAGYEKISVAFIYKKKYDIAQKYLNKALAYELRAKEMAGIIDGYTFLGNLQHAQKNYAAAAVSFKKAIEYAISSNHMEREANIYQSLAENQADGHQYDEAYNYESKFNTITDSLNREGAKNSITELTSQYQTERKQQQINLLTQEEKASAIELSAQKRTKYFLMAGLLFVIVVIGLVIRGYRIKQRANLLITEKNDALEIKNNELKMLNDKLDEANKSKTKLFSILSHDLRTPIGSIFQFINLRKNHPQKMTEEESKKHNDRILHSAENLMESMEDILIWSKSQMETFSLQVTPINVCELITDIIELNRDFADEKNIALKMDCSTALQLNTDLNFLKIVLRNIISNSIKFTPAGGSITIGATRTDKITRFTIKDSGVGMSAAQINNIFEWGSIRSDSSGLGLKLAREFTTRLGGEIEVTSEINKGSIFSINLPGL